MSSFYIVVCTDRRNPVEECTLIEISDHLAFSNFHVEFTCTWHFNQFHNKNILHYLAGHFGNSINFLVKSYSRFLIVLVVVSKDDLFVFLYGLGAL